MVKTTKSQLDITADDRIFTPRGVGALDIGIVQCLSELIANSLDWRRFNDKDVESIKKELDEGSPEDKERYLSIYSDLLNAEPVDTEIRVRYDGDSIEIIDNGIGMDIKQLEIGLKLRAATDKRREPLRVRKGMFGMGLKVGILGTGWKFTIRTRSFRESTEHLLKINTRDIETERLKLKEITAETFEKHDPMSPLKHESGTYIKIEDLHKSEHHPDMWRIELGTNFSPEIEYENAKIIIEDSTTSQVFDPCQKEDVAIIPGTKVDITKMGLMVKPDHGDGTRGEPMQIRGWLGLREVSAAGSGRWGVHTFRKGQLVEAFHNNGPKDNGLFHKEPHPMMARVHGELHLDMCDPNFTKVGWNTELESWNDAREAIKDILYKVTRASEEYRKKEGGGAKSKKWQQTAKRTQAKAEQKLGEGEESAKKGTKPEDGTFLDIDEDEYVIFSQTQQAFTEKNKDRFWDYSYRDESKEIAVFLNTESSLWKSAQDSKDPDAVCDTIVNWAIIDSLYFCLVYDLEIEPSRAVNLREKWLKKLYPDDSKEE